MFHWCNTYTELNRTVFYIYIFTAPVCGILINKFSSRTSLLAGGIITSTGFAVCAFVDSLDGIILGAGVVVGNINTNGFFVLLVNVFLYTEGIHSLEEIDFFLIS